MNKEIQFDISNIKAYQGYLIDEDLLIRSSSGGITRALSKAILSTGGTVFGVQYSNDFYKAEYCFIRETGEIDRIIGSKYIYSNKTIEYEGEHVSVHYAVGAELKKGRTVLFFGLGCDVASIKQYLAKKEINTEKLYLVDLICQGPTFQNVQESYLKRLESKYESRVCDFSVRYKLYGWSLPPFIRVLFKNGKQYMESFYGSDFGFAFSRYSKYGCYHCKFRGEGHKSDMTIGDYWGIKTGDDGFNKNGVSLMLVTTEKGNALLSMIDQKTFSLKPADVYRSLSNNPMYYLCRNENKNASQFRDKIDAIGLHRAVINEMGGIKYYYMRFRRQVARILRRKKERPM